MPNILHELYTDLSAERVEPTPEYKASCERAEKMLDAAERALGKEMFDELLSSQSAVQYEEDYMWFREGFRLGASLMLELL